MACGEEMKKCPFCDSKDINIVECVLFNCFYVGCNDCSTETGTYMYRAEAIEAWNTRAT